MNAQHLIERNVRAHTVDGYTAAHMVQAAHEATIRSLVAELRTLKGYGLTAARGCHFATQPLGDSEALIEFEAEAGQREIINADPDDCQEGFAPTVSVLRVFINGTWCDADCISETLLAQWESALLADMVAA